MSASTARSRPRPRPAHTPGRTLLSYTPSGSHLITAGSNPTIRLYRTGFDGEPTNIDDCPEQNLCLSAASDSTFVVGSEDGTVSLYNVGNSKATATPGFSKFLLRSSLAIQAIAVGGIPLGGLATDGGHGTWCAIASSDAKVSLVDLKGEHEGRVRLLKEHDSNVIIRDLSFDAKGSLLCLSGSDGKVYVYSLTAEEGPELIRIIEDLIPVVNPADDDDDSGAKEGTGKAVWHPDGRAFAVPTRTRDVQVVSKGDWENQRAFKDGHTGAITALAWSPNGALLATAGRDGQILVWETKTQTVVHREEKLSKPVLDMAWHPTGKNILSFSNAEGEVTIFTSFLPEQWELLLAQTKIVRAPFVHDPLDDATGGMKSLALQTKQRQQQRKLEQQQKGRERSESLGSLASLLDDPMDEDDPGLADFVVDDDGAGYAPASRKRPLDVDDEGLFGDDGPASKRRHHLLSPTLHEPFQQGSTPWRGNRKYLCLNLTGFVWTVDQDSHHTVTVEFYDNDRNRNFKFTDTYSYDKACLSSKGALFACPSRPAGDGKEAQGAHLFYRPHSPWTQRSDVLTHLPAGEDVVAMSLSTSFITVITTAGYCRIFTLFGTPHRVYRPKSLPAVTCASHGNKLIMLGNGPMGSDGRTQLTYTIEDVRTGEVTRDRDVVALPEGGSLKGVFWSEDTDGEGGDPYVYDSSGTLLTLLHWRNTSGSNSKGGGGQGAVWCPVLDTKLLPRLAGGRKKESYFPVAVADDKFHCIILKGGDKYPYFPRPLLSEFEFSVPISSAPVEYKEGDDSDGEGGKKEEKEAKALQQSYLLSSLKADQLLDLLDSTSSRSSKAFALEASLNRKELDIDKTLLQLLAAECRAGEERGMRALELVLLMRDGSGKMVEAAGKVADRYGRQVLGDRIREVGERRIMRGGEEDGDEESEGDERGTGFE